MSTWSSPSNPNSQEAEPPRRLELSLNPGDGSLLTAPLVKVLLSTTDALYSDIYNMAQGELDVTATAPQAEDADNQEEENVASAQLKKERMSNLSFAQRRHELGWRLARHGKAIQHTAALTAAAASSDLAQTVEVSSRALQHARTAWVQADEAQDALFFFHAQLFPARAAPHDIYGAADVLLAQRWFDLPNDLRLTVDRYETSPASRWSLLETDQRWNMAVREKLLMGEVGWAKRTSRERLWKVSVRGGLVRLTQGEPKGSGSKAMYPIEALLTVFPSKDSEWVLLSLDTRVQAKTGEFNHQLETSNRQRYDLHRLAALSMSREEARAREKKDEIPAQPLQAVFSVAHVFSLSWQLQVLSAQAQALRRGVWAAGEGYPLSVTPVQFMNIDDSNILGVVSISFWKVDDAYGPPSMGDLSLDAGSVSNGHKRHAPHTNQLTLSIRAESDIGIKVSLSGAASILAGHDPRTRSTCKQLLEAACNPFYLSASDALLAATRLCAERKCWSVVQALQPTNGPSRVSPWIRLEVEQGSIAVAACVSYHGIETTASWPTLFRLTCDARTGSFVSIFSRSMKLLRGLASNEHGEPMALRVASLAQTRQRRAAGANSSGRLVRDAFNGLIRSMNLLGQRTAVGGAWDDLDGQSARLRERAIVSACSDVKTALIKCCGMTALYGLTPVALSSALGLDAIPDMAGDSLDAVEGTPLLRAPPLSTMVDQQLVETSTTTSDGVSKMASYMEQTLFCVVCSVTETSLTLLPLEINVKLDSPTSIPSRTSLSLFCFKQSDSSLLSDESSLPEAKRRRVEVNGNGVASHTEDIMVEVTRFAGLIQTTIDSEFDAQ